MRIPCPHCGERDHAEFAYRGDAAPRRPPLRGRGKSDPTPRPEPDMLDYVYIRENRPGLMRELWQHVGGCRAWIVVERDVTSHRVGRAEAASVAARGEAAR